MKLKTLLFIITFILSEYTVHAQASWSYSIWFNLKDKYGNIIDKNDYDKKRIKLLTNEFSVHSNGELVYDTLTNSFRFSQHTAVTGSVLMFIQEMDTTIIEIGTTDLYLDTISLTGNLYEIRVWNNEDSFVCKEKLHGYKNTFICKNKYPFNTYVIVKEEDVDFPKLREVKIK